MGDRQGKPMIVVGCGKAKVWKKHPRPGKIQAQDAYVGSLFKLSRRFAEKREPHNWLILSAKYGLIRPNRQISNYDVTIGSRGAITAQRIRGQWRRLAKKQTASMCLASKKYVRLLRDSVPKNVRIKTPMDGLDLFERTAWLKRRR